MTINNNINALVALGDYSVTCQNGSNKVLILAFAGIGSLLSDKTGRHFRGALEEVFPDSYRLYIVDTARFWFNSQYGFVDLLSEINQLITEKRY